MIRDVAFVAYAVRDTSQAVAFYQHVVGLGAERRFNDEYVEFDVGSTTFALDAAPPGYEPGTCSGVNFEVDDIESAHKRLQNGNAAVSEIYDFPTCFICFAKDIDGNAFGLHQRKAS